MNTVRVGVQLQPQHCTISELRDVWQAADALPVDSIWVWDHFFPLTGDPDGAHFEGWSLLAAMAVDTEYAKLGTMVACNTYRNPDLLADMARTVDHLSGGRLYLGVGAGWFEHDYAEYGYPFGTRRNRLDDLVAGLERITARLPKLNPPPVGRLPILIGASGEKISLSIVARFAQAWNTYGTPEVYAAKNAVLDGWCAKLGRDPGAIERTVLIAVDAVSRWRDYVAAGAAHRDQPRTPVRPHIRRTPPQSDPCRSSRDRLTFAHPGPWNLLVPGNKCSITDATSIELPKASGTSTTPTRSPQKPRNISRVGTGRCQPTPPPDRWNIPCPGPEGATHACARPMEHSMPGTGRFHVRVG